MTAVASANSWAQFTILLLGLLEWRVAEIGLEFKASQAGELRENEQTAGPSTPLRSGRDDKVVTTALPKQLLSPKERNTNLVIPTGAKRSGGTCSLLVREWSLS